MKFLETDSLAEAREKLLHAMAQLPLTIETVALPDCLDRILAEQVTAPIPVPDFRKSTVDGYAVRAADTQGAGESIPCFLTVVGEVHIGAPAPGSIVWEHRTTENATAGAPTSSNFASGGLGPGQCMYVPTGGMVPDGADAVVMVEHVEHFDDTSLAVYDAVSPGRNVIQIGEDAQEGQPLLEKGKRLTPQDIGVLASIGRREVQAYAMPRVTILSTGDELVAPGEEKEPAQVYDINTYGLLGQCRRWGLPVVKQAVVADDAAAIRAAIAEGMQAGDMVVLSGGSSKGRADFTEDSINELASPGVFTHGIRIKPGKPTILGLDEASRTLLVGLPGHPAAAMMVFDLVVLQALRDRLGVPAPRRLRARMEVNVAGGGGRAVCQMVQLIPAGSTPGARDGVPAEGGLGARDVHRVDAGSGSTNPSATDAGAGRNIDADGIYTARPLLGASGLIGLLSRADGYVMIDEDREGLKQGEIVDVLPL